MTVIARAHFICVSVRAWFIPGSADSADFQMESTQRFGAMACLVVQVISC